MKPIVEMTHLYFSQRPLVICIAGTLAKAGKAAGKVLGRDLGCENESTRTAALCISTREGATVLLFVRKHLTAATICHEVTHATNNIFLDMGIKLNPGSDEAYAYHNDMLFGMVAELLKGHKITIPLA